jgi:hypothetical protein
VPPDTSAPAPETPAFPRDVPLSCACRKLRGTALDVAPGNGCRVVCYCDDCQAFARFLGRSDITDAWGGTDVLQVAPRSLRLDDPSGVLACVRLSPKGMHRWYCAECRTPIGNAMSARVPFVGLIHCFMDHASDERTRDELLGPPYYSQGKFAAAGLPKERQGVPWGAIKKSASLLGSRRCQTIYFSLSWSRC